jgi:hypothetical protein
MPVFLEGNRWRMAHDMAEATAINAAIVASPFNTVTNLRASGSPR